MGPGTLIAARFELQHLAGEGGMGAVYRAHDRLTGNAVAVKVLTHVSEDCEERFMREARALAELNHAAVVGHLDHGRTHDDRAYLVMEWLEGEELSTRLASREPQHRRNPSPGVARSRPMTSWRSR